MKLILAILLMAFSAQAVSASTTGDRGFVLLPGDALKVTIEPIIPGRPGFKINMQLNAQKKREFAAFVEHNVEQGYASIVTDFQRHTLLKAYLLVVAQQKTDGTLSLTFGDLATACGAARALLDKSQSD